jgi:hypothetical protein
MTTPAQIDTFIARWQAAGGSERANYQLFITELCELLDLPKPEPAQADARDNAYVFERRVTFAHGDGSNSNGFIDCYRRTCFILEAKQTKLTEAVGKVFDDALLRARAQAENYARALPADEGRPPFLIVVDVGNVIELYAEFSRTGATYTPFPDPSSHRIRLADLREDKVRARLRSVWLDPLSLDPATASARVTREIADRLAVIAKSLEGAHSPEIVAGFLTRCLFSMFAEDVQLIPARAFTGLLDSVANAPEQFQPLVAQLWGEMDRGGFSVILRETLPRINGKLFKDTTALPLTRDQINLLQQAAKAEWTQVEPAIFGTLLTRSLDPACGTANFLYVTLEHLKRLEGEVLDLLDQLGDTQGRLETEGLTVDPHQFLGLELNPRAAAIAELVLWIGYLQWHYRTRGNVRPPEPVLRDFKNIECRDAVLAEGKPAEWPQADYVVGNPPFIGKLNMRAALGDDYVEALRNAYPDVPDSADLVMFWWHKAAALVASGQLKQFGLITTNSLTQTFNRRVVEMALRSGTSPFKGEAGRGMGLNAAARLPHPHPTPPLEGEGTRGLHLAFAIADHPWVDGGDGAAVRIAMTVGAGGTAEGRLLTVTDERATGGEGLDVTLAEQRGAIHADLTIGANVAAAKPLRANGGISSPGFKLHGAGFIVTPEERAKLEADAPIKDYRNGKDLTDRPRGVLLIDLFGHEAEEVRRRWPATYQRVLDTVKPDRDSKAHTPDGAGYARLWWLHGKPRQELRKMLAGLPRYIATVETAKHRVFQFLDIAIAPDNMLVCVALDDAYALGVLSSRVHVVWALATGGRLGIGNDPRYNKSRCFETFPFPAATPEQQTRIRDLAEQLDAHRKRVLAEHADLTLTGLYNVLQKVGAGGTALTAKEKAIYDKGLVGVLKSFHDDLDAAVLAAYGWADLLPSPPAPPPGGGGGSARRRERGRVPAPFRLYRLTPPKPSSNAWLPSTPNVPPRKRKAPSVG